MTDVRSIARNEQAGANLWQAREVAGRLLFPVWPPLAAPVVDVVVELPRVVTFYLSYHRWHLRIRLAPYGPTDGQPDDINLETAIKPAGPISLTFRDWEPFAFARLSEPIMEQTVEAALYEMKRLLWERDDVARFVAGLYARR